MTKLSVDGASVSTGLHGGLGVEMKETASCLNMMHCFIHSLELAVRDTFDKIFLKKLITRP